MPNIQALQRATTPITLSFGDAATGGATITLRALLNRAGPQDAKYKELTERILTLDAEREQLSAELVNARTSVIALIEPTESELLALRSVIVNALKEGTDALRVYAVTTTELKDGEAPPVPIDSVQAALERGWGELAAFDAKLLPSDEEVNKRARKADVDQKKIEAKLKANNEAQSRVACELLAHLIDPADGGGWDLTEGEGDEEKPWPPTPENIATFKPDFIELMLLRCQEAVNGPFRLTPNAITNS